MNKENIFTKKTIYDGWFFDSASYGNYALIETLDSLVMFRDADIPNVSELKELSKKAIWSIDLPEFITDFGIKNNVMYFCSSGNVFSLDLSEDSPKTIKMLFKDIGAQSISVSPDGRIAISASSEGLYLLEDNELHIISHSHSLDCEWGNGFVVNKSHVQNSVLVQIGNKFKEYPLSDIFDSDGGDHR